MVARETSGSGSPVRAHGAGSSDPTRKALLALLAPAVAALGYDLEDISVTAAGRRSLVRVIVDSDTGIDLDAVAGVARAVSEILDSSPDAAMAGPYVLEVSSPGVDRPLTEERHWRRAVGRLVTTSVDGVALRGRISSVTTDTVTFDTNGVDTNGVNTNGGDISGVGTSSHLIVQLSRLAPGRVEVEFSRSGQSPDWEDEDAAGAELADDESAKNEFGSDDGNSQTEAHTDMGAQPIQRGKV